MKQFFAKIFSQIKIVPIIILAVAFLLVAVYNISEGASTLDMMEIASDTSAQASYVTNSSPSATGGTITTSGNYRIHTFTGSGTFTPSSSMNVEYLIVAGGRTGGTGGATAGDAGVAGGGGGGGQVIYNAAMSLTSGAKTVTVGGADGNSAFDAVTASTGGGVGQGTGGTAGGGLAGGSGGGKAGGGGGGQTAVGSAGFANGSCGSCSTGGGGGAGYTSAISGANVVYGSGAGGGGGTQHGPDAGADGGGGGGNGAGTGGGCVDANVSTAQNGYAGTANRGGGGGGGGSCYGTGGGGGGGGSGIVIVRYLTLPYLQSYSEATIKTQGSYSLKGVADMTHSLNFTLTRNMDSSLIDLSNKTSVTFDIRASRTGSNIKIGLRDSGGTVTEVTPNITSTNVFQSVTMDLSAVSNANKDIVDRIIITILNADAANTFYIDNMTALPLDNFVCTQDTSNYITSNNRYADGNVSGRYVVGLDEGSDTVNTANLELQSCLMTLNSTDTLVAKSMSLTGGSIAIADGAQVKLNQPVWVIDADADGYTTNVKLYYGAQPAGGRRRNFVSTFATTDCNDGSSEVFITSAQCYADYDGDTYTAGLAPNSTCLNTASCATATKASASTNGAVVTTYTAGRLLNSASATADCYNDNANAKPGSTFCSGTNRGDGSFDYNCSGTETKCGTTLTHNSTATYVSKTWGTGTCTNNNAKCNSGGDNTYAASAKSCGVVGATCTGNSTVGTVCEDCGGTSGGYTACTSISAATAQTCQ